MISVRFLLLLLLSLSSLIVSSHGSVAQAQSLFDRRSPARIDMFEDKTARRRGDILTVIVNESTDVENRDERSLDKGGQSSLGSDLTYGLGGGLGGANGTGSLAHSSSSSRSFDGSGELSIERRFLDRFSVVVVDVLPNGNLIVEGERNIFVQEDIRTLKLTGIVRPFDLLPGNAVPSHLIANLGLRLQGGGTAERFTNQGWLGRRFNRDWPF
ncbi:MAG: flagellar basal body L-ring protein FlgH [Planctomycetota bacterium]